mmetsp:Transcript_40653/g.70350  ORF Transcript_40653/g.70350 Transcript_40653/m.70350 type:complete len:121 (-) Transcript_40653:52-414(-)
MQHTKPASCLTMAKTQAGRLWLTVEQSSHKVCRACSSGNILEWLHTKHSISTSRRYNRRPGTAVDKPALQRTHAQAATSWTASTRSAQAPPIEDALADSRTAACAAAKRAMGTRKGEQLT